MSSYKGLLDALKLARGGCASPPPDGRTHHAECWQDHLDCARTRIERLTAERDMRALDAERERKRYTDLRRALIVQRYGPRQTGVGEAGYQAALETILGILADWRARREFSPLAEPGSDSGG